MLRKFLSETDGAVIMMAGVLVPLIAGAVAFSVDYANVSNLRQKAQSAADSAALSAAIQQDRKLGETIFNSRFAEIARNGEEVKRLEVRLDGDRADVSARINTTTFFGSLLPDSAKLDEFVVSSVAQAGSQTPIDVVMALDYSGSMLSDNKYQRMAGAAHTFLDTFVDNEMVRVGVVPFASYTLLGIDGRYLFDTLSGGNLMGSKYLACVSNRGYPNAVQIDTPTDAVQASLWPAIDFAEFSGGSAGTWAAEGVSEWGDPPPWTDPAGAAGAVFELGRTAQYEDSAGVIGATGFVVQPDPVVLPPGATLISVSNAVRETYPSGGFSYWPVNLSAPSCAKEAEWQLGLCGPVPEGPDYADLSTATIPGTETDVSDDLAVHQAAESLSPACADYVTRRMLTRPLSDDFEKLKTRISAMTPSGATNIALAFDTSWHLVSDNQPWITGAENGADKIVILLTDGVQTVPALGSGNEYSIGAANRNTAEVCQAMKNDGVTVYTVAFGVSDTFTQDLLSGCATSLSHYFQPDAGADLADVFAEIAASLQTPARIVQ